MAWAAAPAGKSLNLEKLAVQYLVDCRPNWTSIASTLVDQKASAELRQTTAQRDGIATCRLIAGIIIPQPSIVLVAQRVEAATTCTMQMV